MTVRTPDGWWVTPATVKAVLIEGGRVLLARNPREEWELPGGRPDEGESSVADVVRREVREETGLDVVPGEVLLAELFEVVPGHHLLLVALRARLSGTTGNAGADGDAAPTPILSDEHSDLRWFPVDALPEDLPPLYRVAIERAFPPGG